MLSTLKSPNIKRFDGIPSKTRIAYDYVDISMTSMFDLYVVSGQRLSTDGELHHTSLQPPPVETRDQPPRTLPEQS